MRKRLFAERIFGWYAGVDRGAAMYGDLEELAVTRGRLWFWWEYLSIFVRLLISRRIWANGISAFIWAYLVAFRAHLGGTMLSWTQSQFRPLNHVMPWSLTAWRFMPLHSFWFLVMMSSGTFAPFLLVFVLVRYGLRDRLSQMTCAMFLLTLLFFSLWRGFGNIVLVAAEIMLVAALCLRQWRRPALVLIASVLAGLYALRVQYRLIPFQFHVLSQAYYRHAIHFYVAYAAMAVTCLILHRYLIERPPIFTLLSRPKRVCIS